MKPKRTRAAISHLFLALLLLVGSLTVLGRFSTRQVEAVGVTPPKVEYDPDTYENITPTNGASSGISGGKFVQLTGANQLPKLAVNYVSETTADPWFGGSLNINWTDHVKLTNASDFVSIPLYGYAFVTLINLPKEVLTADVLNALDWTNSKFKVNGAEITLDQKNLFSAGNHTLRLSLGAWDNGNISGVFSTINNSSGFNANDIPLELNLILDIKKLTANSNKFDTSPDKILTKGKLPPALTAQAGISVDFYDANNTVQDRAWNLWGAPAAGRFYPKLNNGALAPSQYAQNANTIIPTWNNYLSPWDNTGKYNTKADTTEYVNGQNSNLPGTTSNREVVLDLSEGSFAQLPQNRFDRVVNFFTGINSTAGAKLTHAPTATTGLNQAPTLVTYSGTDATQIPLSPVVLKVSDRHQLDGNLAPTNLDQTAPYGKFIPSAPFTVKALWKASSLRTGEIRYRLYNAQTKQLVAGFTNSLFQTITNPTGSSSEFTAETLLPKLASGQYYFDYRLKDSLLEQAYPTAAYHWQSENVGVVKLPLITVADLPKITAASQVTNLTTQETGTAITALSTDVIRETQTFTLSQLGNPVVGTKVMINLPVGAQYQAGTLTVNGVKVNDAGLVTSLQVPVTFANTLNNQVKIAYDFKLPGLTNTTVTTKAATLTSQISIPTAVTMPLDPVSTKPNQINIPAAQLSFTHTPKTVSFGDAVQLPERKKVYQASGDHSFGVLDTRLLTAAPWQITATLTKAAQTTSGRQLLSALAYVKNGTALNLIANNATAIYQNTANDRGTIEVNANQQDKLQLEVDPANAIQVNEKYQMEVTWNLVAGPQS
ncbi:hypothetical protein ACFQ4L_03600 [Lapidilactobacillus mulanensis]|uniref:WxL domain-containing protein n=1 Tax=Lapidilactobacillus mulanensis TaxID=2485999 RepID=A0ABW4DQE4_9LACO|nr:hypothetical protein [Lapidilactobacillus mulanensis]